MVVGKSSLRHGISSTIISVASAVQGNKDFGSSPLLLVKNHL